MHELCFRDRYHQWDWEEEGPVHNIDDPAPYGHWISG
jgi:hypothetical protein